ncbi:beta transducin-like protein HET-D2Y [Rhexocercosporidium sp. MPI-PUGE-AT-0058]|nr:beta transducin-like protein HET-D2Y [Rhexocercosporidium sp. MPI-PUGE-AT-0058]
MAYSLLGLFGIYLLFIYREGKEHAFRRLKKEIQNSLTDKEATTLLAYFFCQATDSRINNAAAVLRSLIYLLIVQQLLLVSHVREKYDHAGKALFEDINAWIALCEIFMSVLQDPNLKSTYLVIDALDECERNLYQLLNLIDQTASISSRVKWISRLRLDDIKMRLSLELNEEHVSRAIELFVNLKDQIYAKANSIFLWAAFVIKELKSVES